METFSLFHIPDNSLKFAKFFQEIQTKNPEDFERAREILSKMQQFFGEAIELKASKNARLDYFEKNTCRLVDAHPFISDNTEHLLSEIMNDYMAQIEKMPTFDIRAISEKISKIFQK